MNEKGRRKRDPQNPQHSDTSHFQSAKKPGARAGLANPEIRALIASRTDLLHVSLTQAPVRVGRWWETNSEGSGDIADIK